MENPQKLTNEWTSFAQRITNLHTHNFFYTQKTKPWKDKDFLMKNYISNSRKTTLILGSRRQLSIIEQTQINRFSEDLTSREDRTPCLRLCLCLSLSLVCLRESNILEKKGLLTL